jgi:MraZ protein
MFMGEYRHGIDEKGRLTMPSKYRELVGKSFVLTKGLDGCLFVYPIQEWQSLTDAIERLPLTNPSARAFIRIFLAGACESELDRQGRFLIPSSLREYAALERDAVVCGVGNRLEVWSVDRWEKYVSSTSSSFTELAGEYVNLGI